LQNDEQGLSAVRVQEILQLSHALDMLLDLGQRLFVRLVLAGKRRIDVRQANLFSRLDDEFLAAIHLISPFASRPQSAAWPNAPIAAG